MKTALSIYILGYIIAIVISVYSYLNESNLIKNKSQNEDILFIFNEIGWIFFYALFYPIILLISISVIIYLYFTDPNQEKVIIWEDNYKRIQDIDQDLEEIEILSKRKEIQDLDFFYNTEFIAPPPKTNPETITEEYKLFTPKPIQK